MTLPLIWQVFFTRPSAPTVVQCLPGCEAEGEPAESTGLAPGHKFAPIVARDYRRVADDKRDALDGTDTAST